MNLFPANQESELFTKVEFLSRKLTSRNNITVLHNLPKSPMTLSLSSFLGSIPILDMQRAWIDA